MIKHQTDRHNGVEPNFKAEVVYSLTDCLSRQVAEGVCIRRCQTELLNTKETNLEENDGRHIKPFLVSCVDICMSHLTPKFSFISRNLTIMWKYLKIMSKVIKPSSRNIVLREIKFSFKFSSSDFTIVSDDYKHLATHNPIFIQ